MSDSAPRRKRRVLSPETKWEVFLNVTSGEITQADAARKWQVDVSTIIGIRRTAKDAAMTAFARKPGRPRASAPSPRAAHRRNRVRSQPEVSPLRRVVRATPRFFEDLDRQLRAERGPNGEPSTNDFQVFELVQLDSDTELDW